jgi:hypothetical protein
LSWDKWPRTDSSLGLVKAEINVVLLSASFIVVLYILTNKLK